MTAQSQTPAQDRSGRQEDQWQKTGPEQDKKIIDTAFCFMPGSDKMKQRSHGDPEYDKSKKLGQVPEGKHAGDLLGTKIIYQQHRYTLTE
jgi:hypothetical protein